MPMDLPQSRLDSLYKDFRHLKELNPEGYRANIDTWKSYLIDRYLGNSSSLFLKCGSELLAKLRREPQGVPSSIDVVLASLVESDYLITSDNFYNGTMYPQEGFSIMKWVKWGPWSRGTVNLRGNQGQFYLKNVNLIIKPVIEEKFKHIKAQLNNNILTGATGIADLVFSKQEFYRKCGFHRILNDAEDEREAMLFYLSQYKKLIVQDKDTIKVIAPEVNHVLANFERKITEDDHRIATLNSSLIYIELQMKTLRNQVADYDSMLKDSLSKSMAREIQRKYLQGKKVAEKNLDRLLNQETSLVTIKTQLNVAATNALLFRTLEESNKLLKSVNDSVASVEKVEELLDEIKEQGERAEELNALIAKSPDVEDEAELERELEEMQAEEALKKEKISHKPEDTRENGSPQETDQELVNKLGSLHIGSTSEPQEKDLNSVQRQKNEVIAELP